MFVVSICFPLRWAHARRARVTRARVSITVCEGETRREWERDRDGQLPRKSSFPNHIFIGYSELSIYDRKQTAIHLVSTKEWKIRWGEPYFEYYRLIVLVRCRSGCNVYIINNNSAFLTPSWDFLHAQRTKNHWILSFSFYPAVWILDDAND